jgi:neutral ceramidase
MKRLFVTTALSMCLSGVVVLFAQRALAAETAKQFQAGAATSNITPPLGISINGGMSDRRATHIHDELHARCLVLDDGTSRLAFVLIDSCVIPREIFDAAKRIIQDETKLPADHVLMAATHTHYAPTVATVFQSSADEAYKAFLIRRIADGVRRAINNLATARIGWAVGSEPNQVFNRRWYLKPGTMPENPFGSRDDKVKMNPGVGSKDLVKPAGPTDPDVTIVSVQSPDGRPIALLANYSLHYVGGYPGDCISADYCGAFADRMQQLLQADRLDPPFVAMMSNGTSGNINNINFRGGQPPQPPYGQMRLVANAVAEAAYRAYKTIAYHDSVPLDVRQTTIELGVRLPSDADIKQAREILAKAKGRALRGLTEVYANETVNMATWPKKVELILQAMRIGDLGVFAIPCEVFAEIGLELKAKSPFKPTFTIELANGYNGYLPTPAQHALGGYETWRARSSYLAVDASPKIVSTLLSLATEMANRK